MDKDVKNLNDSELENVDGGSWMRPPYNPKYPQYRNPVCVVSNSITEDAATNTSTVASVSKPKPILWQAGTESSSAASDGNYTPIC